MMRSARGSVRREGRWMPLAPSVRREPVPMRRMTSATTSQSSAPMTTASSTPSMPKLVARATAIAPLNAPSDQPACRVETIDRPSVRLDGHAVRVHREVHRGVDVAEGEHDGCQDQRFRGQPEEGHHEREDQGRHGGDAPAGVAHQELARDLLADERPERRHEQHEPELRGRHAQPGLHARDGGHPGAQHDAVHEEDDESGEPRGHGRVRAAVSGRRNAAGSARLPPRCGRLPPAAGVASGSASRPAVPHHLPALKG